MYHLFPSGADKARPNFVNTSVYSPSISRYVKSFTLHLSFLHNRSFVIPVNTEEGGLNFLRVSRSSVIGGKHIFAQGKQHRFNALLAVWEMRDDEEGLIDCSGHNRALKFKKDPCTGYRQRR